MKWSEVKWNEWRETTSNELKWFHAKFDMKNEAKSAWAWKKHDWKNMKKIVRIQADETERTETWTRVEMRLNQAKGSEMKRHVLKSSQAQWRKPNEMKRSELMNWKQIKWNENETQWNETKWLRMEMDRNKVSFGMRRASTNETKRNKNDVKLCEMNTKRKWN